MEGRYTAGMVLAGVGDAMGFKCGDWEFNYNGEKIHEEAKAMGGVKRLCIRKPTFIVSDDTVLLLSTAEALVTKSKNGVSNELYLELATNYQNDYAKDMQGRSGGLTTGSACFALRPREPDGWKIPFNSRGGGCGAAMRSMCVGLRYPNVFDVSCLEKLIAVSVESGRMTHNHPTGYLGSFASALFGAFSICNIPVLKWGCLLLKLLPKVLAYIKKEGRDVEKNEAAWSYFEEQWKKYLTKRHLLEGESAHFDDNYGIKERDDFYKSLAFANWGGASGHDAPMIAYDALLFAKDDWVTLCHHGMLHSGDNDSTGVIAGFCFGAIYGFKDVPKGNYEEVEYKSRLETAAKKIHTLAVEDNYLDIPTDKKVEATIELLFSS